jgi:RNA polymerase sigma-70 factor (ECF subfamily)
MTATITDLAVDSQPVALAAGDIAPGDLEAHRRALTGYCYRMLGSGFDAEDAVQETMLRAWRSKRHLQDQRSLRAWLFRIATNVCMDALRGAQRRALPMDLTSPAEWPKTPGVAMPAASWIWPVPDERVLEERSDPAERVLASDSIRLAFVAALQRLPPRQRAVFILREVLDWTAAEVAELLDVSAIAVNSALQRARATIRDAQPPSAAPAPTNDPGQDALLATYVQAFERYDLNLLTSLLHLEATVCMPPYDRWLRGPEQVESWYGGPGIGCLGSLLCRVTANGTPAFGQYRPGGKAWALQVVEISDGRIKAINSFLDTERLFPLFGLPPERTF